MILGVMGTKYGYNPDKMVVIMWTEMERDNYIFLCVLKSIFYIELLPYFIYNY